MALPHDTQKRKQSQADSERLLAAAVHHLLNHSVGEPDAVLTP
jgi:hypothetical protein